jgi:hypothetical protein
MTLNFSPPPKKPNVDQPRKIGLIYVLLVIIGVVCLIQVWKQFQSASYNSNDDPELTIVRMRGTIVYPRHVIPAGTVIKASDLVERSLPLDEPCKGGIASISWATGRRAKRTLLPEQPFFGEDLQSLRPDGR